MERYDIAIIGTGPAGLEAAITATIRNKRVILLGSKDLSRKLIKAHEIQNYLGFPAVKGRTWPGLFSGIWISWGSGLRRNGSARFMPWGIISRCRPGRK